MIIALQTLVFFRQSILTILDRLLSPYYKKFSLAFNRHDEDVEEEEEEVFAEFDEEKGVVFFPPMYVQRYAAVTDCLMDERWCGKLGKVVDLGYHDMSFIKYLKELHGVHCILGVDIESIPLRCSSELLGCEDYAPKRETPLKVTLFQGNAADPDFRLIGCDAVVAIEMIEHMLPHDLERLVHNVFGFIKPWIAIFTTPNADFNVLFKALERNGLRRLDHLFEWTREQFHDWCSNIVTRYPQYTVTCQGIGPGPTGTNHYGCCSQLALFVNKDYHKQQDLNLNSLALVAKMPSDRNMDEMIAGWETPANVNEDNMLCGPENSSFTDLLYNDKHSSITIVITPAFSIHPLEYRDNTSQCNLDSENGKNYLMFNDEDMCVSFLVPRRKVDHRVYEIEDVYSRLNCTTLQVKKFSKTTQNLMARNKLDSLIHTREVVNEIRHLTKMLNFDKKSLTQGDGTTHIWSNINWGENAPYWNQYYTVVRECNYPFETKSEECRIVELISEEINRLIDIRYDDGASGELNKLVIPLQQLMRLVRHITDDVDKVKDLLEWNGYEVVNNAVIHSRIIVDNTSVGSQDDDWPDTVSDCDTTDLRSTSLSDGSTIAPDYHGRFLRRALDKKVGKLRSMLSADEDITAELDRVVCRLMKLALRSSKGKQTPPATRWMQCKLLDLLTLTEKAISIRRKHYIDCFPMKALGFGPTQDEINLKNIKDDSVVKHIVDKYQHLVDADQNPTPDFGFEEYFLDEDDSHNTEMLKDYEFINVNEIKAFEQSLDRRPKSPTSDAECKLERTQAWVEDDSNLEVVPYPNHDENITNIATSSGHSTYNCQQRFKKVYKKHNGRSRHTNVNVMKQNQNLSSRLHEGRNKNEIKNTGKSSKTSLTKKLRNRSSSNSIKKHFGKKKYGNYVVNPRKIIIDHNKLQPTASKPIPGSLIELCHPELCVQKNMEEFTKDKKDQSRPVLKPCCSYIAATEESLLIDIIMDDMEETIALRRTIGTDAEDLIAFEQETNDESPINVAKEEKLIATTENVHSQTIFLYDINEPSTSKGVRHVSMDVQCGPDAGTPAFAMQSPASSVTRLPKPFEVGIKIQDSLTNFISERKSFGTSTNDNTASVDAKLIIPNILKKGIEINDSSTEMRESLKFGSFTNGINKFEYSSTTGSKDKNSCDERNKKSFDFGSSTKEDSDYGTMYPTCKTSEITTRDASYDIKYKQHSDLGVSTDLDNYGIITQIPKSPQILTALKDGSSFTEIQHACNFSRNNRFRSLSPKIRAVGIKFKDSDPNFLNKVEGTTTNCNEFSSDGQIFNLIPHNLVSATETKLLKPISSGMEDSGSEFYGSSGSVKSPLHYMYSKNTSDLLLETSLKRESEVNEKMSRTKYIRPKLSCGGVHIHSYKEKQTFEDIVYQGEWQRQTPKLITKKLSPSSINKKRTESYIRKNKIYSKDKMPTNKIEKKEVKIQQKKPIQARNCKTATAKQEVANKSNKNNKTSTPHSLRTIRSNKNITKVSSKIAMNSLTSKNVKTARTVGRPPPVKPAVVKYEEKPEKVEKILKKSYTPIYLRRRKGTTEKNNLNLSTESEKSNIDKSVYNLQEKSLKQLKNGDVKSDLMKFNAEPCDVSYLVFRNELENDNKKSITDCPSSKESSIRKSSTNNNRSSSPASQHSSTCSTPDSIATVRAISTKSKISTKRHSTSSNKSSLGNTESDPATPVRNRKFTKRSKTSKKTEDRNNNNKENVPESSNSNKESLKNVKSAFMSRNNKVYIAQLTTDTSPKIQNSNKSNVKIAAVESNEKERPKTATISKKISLNVNNSLSKDEIESQECVSAELSNTVLFLEPHQESVDVKDNILETKPIDEFVALSCKWVKPNSENVSIKSSSTISATIRHMIEESLDFIKSSSTIMKAMDLELSTLYPEFANIQLDSSSSFKTISESESNLNRTLKSDNENISNDSSFADQSLVSMDNRSLTTDTELISFKSIASSSKYSEYFIADTKADDPKDYRSEKAQKSDTPKAFPDAGTPGATSVRDIFERKDKSPNKNPTGPLAVQAFSGFSMNVEPVAGDQPDYVNLIDSETGSLAMDIARQITSEELFVSGRSSESYESCLIEEDSVVVPNWLFQIISQQQSIVEDNEDQQQLVPLPMPVVEPMFDVNGNMLEPGVGLGAGAGDGRGMHSDQSQDSSGRGTSLSSTDTSSGQQSEAILIDPSALTAQFELLREPINSSAAVTTLVVPADSIPPRAEGERSNSEALSTSRNERRPTNPLLAMSDVDADVSSLDTDVPDSSDN